MKFYICLYLLKKIYVFIIFIYSFIKNCDHNMYLVGHLTVNYFSGSVLLLNCRQIHL